MDTLGVPPWLWVWLCFNPHHDVGIADASAGSASRAKSLRRAEHRIGVSVPMSTTNVCFKYGWQVGDNYDSRVSLLGNVARIGASSEDVAAMGYGQTYGAHGPAQGWSLPSKNMLSRGCHISSMPRRASTYISFGVSAYFHLLRFLVGCSSVQFATICLRYLQPLDSGLKHALHGLVCGCIYVYIYTHTYIYIYTQIIHHIHYMHPVHLHGTPWRRLLHVPFNHPEGWTKPGSHTSGHRSDWNTMVHQYGDFAMWIYVDLAHPSEFWQTTSPHPLHLLVGISLIRVGYVWIKTSYPLGMNLFVYIKKSSKGMVSDHEQP